MKNNLQGASESANYWPYQLSSVLYVFLETLNYDGGKRVGIPAEITYNLIYTFQSTGVIML